MSQYKSYPAYKASGVEWIGQVPEHWEATKLKYVAEFSGGGTPSKENPDYWNGSIPWISPKDMKHEVVTDSIDHITTEGLENSATKLVDSGSVLLVSRSGILRHTIPVGITNAPVSLNQDMKALSLDQARVRPQFILRWVQGFNRSLLGVWAKEGATVESLEHEYVANTPLPLPDLVEQDAILATLDREITRIDALIEKKTRFIELLKEKRQALITHAVTKGLDPNVKMKDSGVEWIGQVPEHWEVKRLRHVGRYANSGVDKKSYEDQQAVELCNYTDVYYNEFISDGMPFMQATASAHEIEQFTLKKGDVIITKDSEDPSDIGIPAFVPHDMPGVVCGYHLTMIRALNDNYGSYIHRSIQSDHTRAHFFVESPGITRYGLNQNTIGNAPVALPPPEEQAAIAATLDRETARIDALIGKVKQSITLLKERRSAFITAAVTGQIDLRGEQ